jgi:predicted small metal-binding protein
MVEHIWKNGFTLGYTRWIFHAEAHRTREEVMRQCVEHYDAEAGVTDMLNDYHEAQYARGCTDDELEPTTKAFYDMFDAAQKCHTRFWKANRMRTMYVPGSETHIHSDYIIGHHHTMLEINSGKILYYIKMSKTST